MRLTVREVIQSELDRHQLALSDSMADDLRLWEWGKWASTTGNNLSFPRCLLPFSAKGWFEKNLRRVIADIGDEEGMMIDKAVTSLPNSHRTIIVAIYRMQVPQRRLMMVMQTSMRQIDYLHHQALGMLWQTLRGQKSA